MKALKESIKDQPQTEASSKFINEGSSTKRYRIASSTTRERFGLTKTTDPT